jgi:hypothetical protein
MRKPCLARPQVPNHFGAQHAGDVGSGGSTATGADFFGDAASADNFAVLENEGGKARTAEIGCRGKSIVSAANNDGVVSGSFAGGHFDFWVP